MTENTSSGCYIPSTFLTLKTRLTAKTQNVALDESIENFQGNGTPLKARAT
jgi:hypothetical protein